MLQRKEKLALWIARREEEKKAQQKKTNNGTALEKSAQLKPCMNFIPKETFSYCQKKSVYSKPYQNVNSSFDGKTEFLSSLVQATPVNVKQKPIISKTPGFFTSNTGIAPAKLQFYDENAYNGNNNDNMMSCKKLREKMLAHSTRKALNNNNQEFKKQEPIPLHNDIAEEPSFHVSADQVRYNNLKKTVLSQVEATQLLMRNRQYEEAKRDLSILLDEIPEAAEVGDYWVLLCQVEHHLHGREAAFTVMAMAFDKLMNRPEEALIVQKACKDLLRTNFQVPGVKNLEDVFKFNPEVMSKPTTERLQFEHKSPIPEKISNEFHSPLEELDLQSYAEDLQAYLGPDVISKPKLQGPSRVLVESAARNQVKREKDAMKIKQEENETTKLGSIVVLAAINAKGKVKSELGTEKVLTPVRRASRHQGSKPQSVTGDLSETGYAYTPNRALSFDDENKDTPRPYNSTNRLKKDTSITPEAVRLELEKLLLG